MTMIRRTKAAGGGRHIPERLAQPMVKLAAGGCRHIPEARGRLSQWSSWRPAAGISPREREWLAQPVKLAAGGAGACISSRGERLAQPVKLAAGISPREARGWLSLSGWRRWAAWAAGRWAAWAAGRGRRWAAGLEQQRGRRGRPVAEWPRQAARRHGLQAGRRCAWRWTAAGALLLLLLLLCHQHRDDIDHVIHESDHVPPQLCAIFKHVGNDGVEFATLFGRHHGGEPESRSLGGEPEAPLKQNMATVSKQ